LKNRIVWIALVGCIVGATVAVIFLATGNGRPPPAPPQAVKKPSGETVNQATGAALKALSECMKDCPLPQCRQKPTVKFIFSARGGGGRILDLNLEKGWLDPDLFKCWKKKLEKILVPAPDQTGKVNVQYPVACDDKGKIHIRPPAWGGSISKKNLPKR
jgi:hypothetical protein